ncbi:hypothetical protein ACFSJU_01760 [Paradesertivirga mongoliensis]|uniref:Uncharacterized protein n=1 Tax=Paradesertivirga mongoliensis TaxID=2100740 RepID=A0ABW4ZHD4_9SPHI|nr:hypothetical protein [Pedobacter mongoliensis]
MKQTTKVLLPLGLFMSIVIPVTVKSLFTETDFFESDGDSKIDFLQPYKTKPETVTGLPELSVGEDGEMQILEPSPQSRVHSQSEKSSERGSRERKLNMPSSITPASQSEAVTETSSIGSIEMNYK